ncbi:MAG: hypothetical protein OXC99_02950 [Chloroflexi bacterium]|nr:hypothetical protein [Chloroflexota bacterium]
MQSDKYIDLVGPIGHYYYLGQAQISAGMVAKGLCSVAIVRVTTDIADVLEKHLQEMAQQLEIDFVRRQDPIGPRLPHEMMVFYRDQAALTAYDLMDKPPYAAWEAYR